MDADLFFLPPNLHRYLGPDSNLLTFVHVMPLWGGVGVDWDRVFATNDNALAMQETLKLFCYMGKWCGGNLVAFTP